MGSQMETVVPLRFVLVALAVVVSLAVVVGIAVWQTSDAGDADPETSHATNGKIQGRFGLADLEGVDQPRDGERFPVGRSELYLNYSTRDQALDKLIETDYDCRYSQSSRNCYCCGAFFHYTEQGKICTKFCLKWKGRGKRPRFCQKRLIQLPFNWGDDYPDKITLDNRQRWSEGTKVKFPYQESSAPRGCPQDPYNVEGSTQKEETGRALPRKSAPPPATSPATSTTTRPRRPKSSRSGSGSGSRSRSGSGSGSGFGSGCTGGSECLPL